MLSELEGNTNVFLSPVKGQSFESKLKQGALQLEISILVG